MFNRKNKKVSSSCFKLFFIIALVIIWLFWYFIPIALVFVYFIYEKKKRKIKSLNAWDILDILWVYWCLKNTSQNKSSKNYKYPNIEYNRTINYEKINSNDTRSNVVYKELNEIISSKKSILNKNIEYTKKENTFIGKKSIWDDYESVIDIMDKKRKN